MILGYILESKGERERVRGPGKCVLKDIPHKQIERICVHVQERHSHLMCIFVVV